MLGPFKIRYFGASVDTPETNRRFAASLGIDYPILSYPARTAVRAYGVIGRSGFPSRWTFYISRDGRILEIDKHVRVTTHGTDVAARLTELAARGERHGVGFDAGGARPDTVLFASARDSAWAWRACGGAGGRTPPDVHHQLRARSLQDRGRPKVAEGITQEQKRSRRRITS